MTAIIIALEDALICPDIQNALRRIQNHAVDGQPCRQAGRIHHQVVSCVKRPLTRRPAAQQPDPGLNPCPHRTIPLAQALQEGHLPRGLGRPAR